MAESIANTTTQLLDNTLAMIDAAGNTLTDMMTGLYGGLSQGFEVVLDGLATLGGGFLDLVFQSAQGSELAPSGQGKAPTTNTLYNAAASWTQPKDPLALDLDGDGIETLGADGSVLFDHDADGLAIATGWLRGDDGWLVWDKDGNGTIDDGRELFGVDYVKSNGHLASDGFDALSDLDSNGDSQFTAADSRFNDLRIWRDLNQDGISQADELKTLAETGITAINLAHTATNTNLGSGNVATAKGTYTLADGTTRQVVNLDLAQNPFWRDYTDRHFDQVAITEQAQALPDLQASGQVRDLREAMSLDGTLAETVASLSGMTRGQMQDTLDGLIDQWAGTSTLQTSIQQAADQGLALIYLAPGQSANEIGYFTGSGAWNGDATALALLTQAERDRLEELQAQQQELTRLMGILERFNGRAFVTLGTNGVTTGSEGNIAAFTTSGDGWGSLGQVAYVSLSDAQVSLLEQSYGALRESIYDGLALQRLSPYLDTLSLALDDNGLGLDFSGMRTAVQALAATPQGASSVERLISKVELSGSGHPDRLAANETDWSMAA